jgi:hypothetical protein
MAIDMIEENELSALAPQRSGFKNDVQKMPKKKRTIGIDDKYSNFTIFGKEIELSHTSKEGTQYEIVKRGLPMDEKSTCESLQSIINNLDGQIEVARKKAISNNTAGERADAQDEANGKSRYRSEVLERMKSMKCDIDNKDIEQKKNLEEALYLTKNILEQGKTKSNTFTYIIIGGVVAISVVAFIVIRNAKKGTSTN